MLPVAENAVYTHSDRGLGAGSSSCVGGTLLEMHRVPDMQLDAAGPSNAAQHGSTSSSEVGSSIFKGQRSLLYAFLTPSTFPDPDGDHLEIAPLPVWVIVA